MTNRYDTPFETEDKQGQSSSGPFQSTSGQDEEATEQREDGFRPYDPKERSLVRLDSQGWLGPERVADALMTVGIPYAEVSRACRRQRGILLRRLDSLLAETATELLRDAGVGCKAVSESEFPDFPRRVTVTTVQADDLGLTFPSIQAIGRGGFVPWDQVAFAAVGFFEGETAHSLQGVESTLLSGVTSHEDHRTMGVRSFEAAADAKFDLGEYLDTTPEEAVNLARAQMQRTAPKLSKRMARLRRGQSEPVSTRFVIGNPLLEARLLLYDGMVAWTVEGHASAIAVEGKRAPGHWMRAFHDLARITKEQATSARLDPGMLAFVQRAERADYLCHDWQAFDEGCRWWLSGEAHAAAARVVHPGSFGGVAP